MPFQYKMIEIPVPARLSSTIKKYDRHIKSRHTKFGRNQFFSTCLSLSHAKWMKAAMILAPQGRFLPILSFYQFFLCFKPFIAWNTRSNGNYWSKSFPYFPVLCFLLSNRHRTRVSRSRFFGNRFGLFRKCCHKVGRTAGLREIVYPCLTSSLFG